jgi:hypothetical protein
LASVVFLAVVLLNVMAPLNSAEAIDMTFNLHDISPTEKMTHLALSHGVSLTQVIYVAFHLPIIQNLMTGHLTVCHFTYIVKTGS